VCFWLLFVGLQHAQLPGLGSAAAPVAASIVIIGMLLLATGLLRIHGESFRDIGLRFKSKAAMQFVVGFGLGVVVVAIMMALLLVFTPLEIQLSADRNTLAVIGASFLVFFVLSLMEEIVFRSYPLFKLRQAWGIRPAVYITSVAFAFYHGLDIDNLLGPGVWGLFYAWMAISTSSVVLPTGFHLGLNWLQGLLGMKPQYSASIWELSIGPGSGFFGVETLGLLMQVTLLVGGILIIESLVTKQGKKGPASTG
jgi:membrane protease YdiL (CAAX protease family)